MFHHPHFPYMMACVMLLFSLSGCTITSRPTEAKDDLKPGRGLFTGEKGYFEIHAFEESESPSKKK